MLVRRCLGLTLRSQASKYDISAVCRRFSAEAAVQIAAKEPESSSQPSRRHTKPEFSDYPRSPINIHDAVAFIKKHSWAKFDETVEITINTGLDPRKPNQNIKGVARLPHGTGKKIRICVIATGEDAELAKQAGADVAGADEAIALIQGGDVNFNTIIATPEMMSAVGKIGRILGPRGLMPNPKMGTVTKDVAKAVKAAKAGAVSFKTERRGSVQAGVGKVSFNESALLDNARALFVGVADCRPEASAFKGKFLTGAYLSSTMGPAIPLELSSIDPSSPKFMLKL